MPRKAREKSESGNYHIILRGINKQIIFEDEEDNTKFLQTLNEYKDKSEPIENESYFLTVLRYIHQNPVKAGITKDIESYKWSSYNEFIDKEEIADIDFVLKIFDRNREKAIEKFKTYHKEINDKKCLDIEEKMRLTDDEAIEVIKRICNLKSCLEIQKIDQHTRDKYLKRLKEEGLSTRQITRLTGISRGIVLKS
ncbi:hypothetical protein SAMN05446037_10554 [Anaerovirgula multivorans]|uniref:Transposase n=1 Tax=Anaerovirgula multivorans TaxID=312168 RepID=A0A239KW83_9FIRM|nr:hypothetical protein [Anaerovirgula multivorans]SNT21898.1 hypothetical protein SAMN05446037_10554 [Anaerovirgula multivorans]